MEKFTFLSGEHQAPRPIVESGAQYIQPGSRVLDFGIGSGRNSVFLAEKGFEVDGYDISEKAVAELEHVVEERKLPMHVYQMDFQENTPSFAQYGFVNALFVLHFLSKERGEEIVKRMTQDAPSGAVHVHAVITAEGDFYAVPKNQDKYYPKPGELREFYENAGWDIKEFFEKSQPMLAKHEDGTPAQNLVSFLVAVKK